MIVYRDFKDIPHDNNTIITVGTFDGVHRGHHIVINKLLELAKSENLRPILVTMDPHPQIILQKKDKPAVKLLSNINERIRIFSQIGLPQILVITFSYEFSQTPADEFIREYLHKKVGIKKMLVGYDHMFGKNRSGDNDLLTNLSQELGFEFERMSPLANEDTIISSTKIRAALNDNKIELANEMLGYDYFVEGIVVAGDSRGKQIGYPTANIMPPDNHKLLPANGVYFVSSEVNGKTVYGMANVGTRPTFTNDIHTTLEVHFLDFNQDLYNLTLNISFHKFIRSEKKFSSVDELINQIQKDEESTRKFIQ
jgi:riboflavin kinase/FMN adenylyltransferase